MSDELCECEKWLTTAELIEELRRLDPSGKRRMAIYDHPDWELLRPRDIGTSSISREMVIAVQHADWPAHSDEDWR